MKRSGFFTRKTAAEARAAKRVGVKAQIGPTDLRKMGPAAVRGMNPRAKHPEMKPSGPPDPMVYVLGEAPGKVEDLEGEPFVGPSGALLRDAMPRWGEEETRFDNCVRTRPPDNRKPKAEEIECFRGVVTESIAAAKPLVILGLGSVPLKWMLSLDKANIKAARGKRFPVTVGGHTCWFMPTLHPAFLLRIEGAREDKVPAEEWMRFWEQDIKAAYHLADCLNDGDEEAPQVEPINTVMDGIEHCLTIRQVEQALQELRRAPAIGFDVETHGLRPYRSDAMFLSIALSDGKRTFAIPIDHPGTPWATDQALQRPVLFDLLRELLVDGPIWVAHNLPHDYEWLLSLLGQDVHKGCYGCSQQAAFALNPGPPGMGAAGHRLEDLCLEYFGLPLKKLTPGARWVDRLRELPVHKVLNYNALDAKWCLRLWKRLMQKVEAAGLEASYRLQIERVPAIVHAQVLGVPIDQKERRRLESDLTDQIAEVIQSLAADDDVRRFERNEGTTFNPGSLKQVGQFLAEGLGIDGVKTKKGYTTAAGVLEQYKDEHPIVGEILKLRSLEKLRGTYVQRFDPEHKETYVYPDGRIHCRFSIARARTARLASEEPNNQNWPKRKNKHVRKQIAAPDGHVFVAVDQGQIEARVLAMESCDPAWIRMIGEKYDVHGEWAQKIAQIDVDFAELLEKDPKYARHRAKNEWVFPSFYGSSIRSIIGNLELVDERAAESLFKQFWRTFAGIKRWQQRQWKKYERDGYVTSLTGRRRWGPLSYNMAINTPIQVTASDICVDAMMRLFWRSRKEGKPWLAPLLQVHDDLTFIVPEKHLSDAIAIIVEEQLSYEAAWVNVPLSVEVEVGPNLLEMDSVGEWTSDDLEAA